MAKEKNNKRSRIPNGYNSEDKNRRISWLKDRVQLQRFTCESTGGAKRNHRKPYRVYENPNGSCWPHAVGWSICQR